MKAKFNKALNEIIEREKKFFIKKNFQYEEDLSLIFTRFIHSHLTNLINNAKSQIEINDLYEFNIAITKKIYNLMNKITDKILNHKILSKRNIFFFLSKLKVIHIYYFCKKLKLIKKKKLKKLKLDYLIIVNNKESYDYINFLFKNSTLSYRLFSYNKKLVQHNPKKFINFVKKDLKFFSNELLINQFLNEQRYIEKIISKINPSCFITLEGDSYLDQIFGMVAKKHNKSCICFQWGSFPYNFQKVGYKKMSCTDYISWGKFFSKQIKKDNDFLIHDMGNPLIKKNLKVRKNNKDILIILQADFGKKYFLLIQEYINWASNFFKKSKIIIRIHPNHLYIKNKYFNFSYSNKNVIFQNPNQKTIFENFRNTFLVVSYSSTVNLEALAYNIPNVFFGEKNDIDLITPDLKKIKNTYVISSLKNLKKISILIYKKRKKKLIFNNKALFTNVGQLARKKIISFLIEKRV